MLKLSLITVSIALSTSLLSGCNDSTAPADVTSAQAPVTTTIIAASAESAKPVTLFDEWIMPNGLPSPIGVKPFIQLIDIDKSELNKFLLVGYSGCNSFRGQARYKGQSLSVSNIEVNEKVCDSSRMQDQEASLIKHLNSTASYAIDGQQLALLDKNQAVLITLTAK
jgi:heat shock protein HslJ